MSTRRLAILISRRLHWDVLLIRDSFCLIKEAPKQPPKLYNNETLTKLWSILKASNQ